MLAYNTNDCISKIDKYVFLFFFLVLIFLNSSSAQNLSKPIIFDSDMGPDYDDVGAIAVLHALADSGYVDIIATVSSNKYEGVASVIDVFNTYYNRPDIPIGVPKGNAVAIKDPQHWTDTLLAKYPYTIKANDQVPGAVEVYRKVLSAQPDSSVTIVTVGFLTNLANLLQSEPDTYSSLNGKELVAQKVKLLVSMAGRFPSGREFNLLTDSLASKIVFENWSTKVLFDGFEIGVEIKTGLPLIHNESITNSPVKEAFSVSIPLDPYDAEGRRSWDEVAVLVAALGHEPWFSLEEGRIVINGGFNCWDSNGNGQFYLKLVKPVKTVEGVINDLMMHQPD